jgi:hypothetical protein
MILQVDRTVPIEDQIYPLFGNPRAGREWGVWQGSPESNGLNGIGRVLNYSLNRNQFDFSEVVFDNGDGKEISGENKYSQLSGREEKVLLDAQIGFTLWFEENHKTLEYLRLVRNINYLEFYGTVFRRVEDAGTARYVFFLYHHDHLNGWKWGYRPLINACSLMHKVPYINLQS